jgi:hypothetical protein
MIVGFLLGVIATASIVASIFFLRFWRVTRDPFFLAFAASFFVEGVNRASLIFLPDPSTGYSCTYAIRLLSFILILAGILRKNFGKGN